MDFLDLIDPNQGVWLFEQWVPRARLGLHLRLAQIYERATFDDASTGAVIVEYLTMTGLETEGLTGLQVLQAFLVLGELNRLKGLFAYQTWNGPDKTKAPPYTYPGRAWTLYIHKIASRYGWTRDDIFNLWPEEVGAYLQEILVAEYDEADERRSLTQIAYRYDEATKKSNFIPLARPSWMMDRPKEKKYRIRRDMLPVGNVIDLTHRDDFTIH